MRVGELQLGARTWIMGVLNVTPDSFSDGGRYSSPEAAIEYGLQMEREGADIIDVGGESTRPGSLELSTEEEWSRLALVLPALRKRLRVLISIDTRKSEIATRALAAGADIVNDVSGLCHDPRMGKVVAENRVPVILMHMRGEPSTMQKKPIVREVIKDVSVGLRESLALARQAGIAKSRMVLDPGIGFGKSYRQNYELLRRLPELAALGYPLLVGTSRKGFIGKTLAEKNKTASKEEMLWGTAATVSASILNGAHIVRVHNVAEMVLVARVADCCVDPALAQKLK